MAAAIDRLLPLMMNRAGEGGPGVSTTSRPSRCCRELRIGEGSPRCGPSAVPCSRRRRATGSSNAEAVRRQRRCGGNGGAAERRCGGTWLWFRCRIGTETTARLCSPALRYPSVADRATGRRPSLRRRRSPGLPQPRRTAPTRRAVRRCARACDGTGPPAELRHAPPGRRQ